MRRLLALGALAFILGAVLILVGSPSASVTPTPTCPLLCGTVRP